MSQQNYRFVVVDEHGCVLWQGEAPSAEAAARAARAAPQDPPFAPPFPRRAPMSCAVFADTRSRSTDTLRYALLNEPIAVFN